MNYTGRPSISGCRPVLSLYPTHCFCQYLLRIFITFTNSSLFNRAFSTNSRKPSQSRFARQLPQRGSLWRVGQASTGRAKHNVSGTVVLRCLGQRQLDKVRLSRSRCPRKQGPPFCAPSGFQRLDESYPACQWLPLWGSWRAQARLRGLAASFPVSFWRNVWYNGFAVHPAYLTGEEVDALAYFLTFLVSVGADVVSHFICKWLDRCEENRKA